MTTQYALRFDSGERRGETIALSAVVGRGGVFTIGRQPGNSLQVTDASVSGRHAEIRMPREGLGVFIRDLGSTNGTQVDGRRITEATLAAGGEFVLGAVQFTLLDTAPKRSVDGELELEPVGVEPIETVGVEPVAVQPVKGGSGAARTGGLGETRIEPREEALQITAADLARSKRSSKAGPIVLGVAALGAVGAFLWSRSGGSDSPAGNAGSGAANFASVEVPSGLLLPTATYSFEGARDAESGSLAGWTLASDLTVPFEARSGAARSGGKGIRAELGAGETALATSDGVDASKPVIASAWVLADSDVIDARIGLRYSFQDAERQDAVVYSRPAAIVAGDFVQLQLASVPPLGAEAVAVIVKASSTRKAPVTDDVSEPATEDGLPEDDAVADAVLDSVDFDDVALVVSSSAGDFSHTLGPWTAGSIGAQDGKPVALSISWREQLFSPRLGVRTQRSSSGDESAEPLPTESLLMEVRPDGDELLITPSGRITPTKSGTGALAELIIDTEFAASSIATLGAAGFASHGAVFERADATSVMAGSGLSQLRLRFETARAVKAREAGGRVKLSFPVTAGETFALQLAFSEERALADRLARRARGEFRDGALGASYESWGQLLDQVPFDAALVDEAAAAQGDIDAEARVALAALTADVERARFFLLGDLYRQKLAELDAVTLKYSGTSVEGPAASLRGVIEAEIDRLGSDATRDEALRLEGIRAALDAEGAQALAGRMGQGGPAGTAEAAGAATIDGNDKTPNDGQER